MFIAPMVLLAYFENPERTKKTDLISAAVLLVSAFIDPLITLYFVPMTLLPVWILKRARQKAPNDAYIASIAAPMPFFILLTFSLIFVPSVKELVMKSMSEFIAALTSPLEGTADKFGDMGVLSFFVGNKELAAKYLTYLLPCIAFSVISLFVFVTDRIRPKFSETGEILPRYFRLPDKLVWLFIVGGFLILIDNEYVKFVSINIIVIFGMLYFFQGVQMMSFLFDRIRIGGIFRGFIYVFLFTEPPVMAIVALMGLFSIWFRPKWSMPANDNEETNDRR